MPVVGPIKETTVPVVYDTDSGGFGGPLDMRGPEIGSVSYSQPGGNLLIKVKLEFGQPNTKYQVFLVCGPAHNASCGFITVGVVGTDAAGAGTANITVPAGVLENAPFGPGFRNDHIDFLRGAGDISKGTLTAGALNYFVCRRAAGAKEAAKPVPKEMQKVSEGDPSGASK